MNASFVSIELPDLYPIVLAEAGFLSFMCLIVGFMAGGKRGKLFNEEFMNEHFKEVHEKELKSAPPKGGYPDCGTGRYSEKLSYKDWILFNQDQRTHKNFLEHLPIVVFLLLASGVVYPIWTISIGGVYILARIIYTIGYRSSVAGRKIGALLIMLSILALYILSFVAIGKWIHDTPW